MNGRDAIPREDDGRPVKYAWPGGYRVWYLTADGGTLCAECVTDNLAQCEDRTDGGAEYAQWRVVGWWPDESSADLDEECGHCGRYRDPDAPEGTSVPDGLERLR